MHPLKVWLQRQQITEAAFAKTVRPRKANGRTRKAPGSTYISQLITGYRFPSRPMAFAIQEATGGEVTAAQMLTYQPNEQAA